MTDSGAEADSAAARGSKRTGMTWGPLFAIFFVVGVYFLSQIIGQLVVSIYPAVMQWSETRTLDWLSNSTIAQFIYICIAELLGIGLIYIFLKHRKLGLQAIGLVKLRLRDALLALIALPAYFIIYVIVLTVATSLVPSLDIDQKQQIGFTGAHTPIELVLIFLSLVIIPPLAEEIMMRGFLLSSLMKKLSVAAAAILTSVIFAAAHLQYGSDAPLLWIAAIDTFTLSLVLCYLRIKTGSLWPGIGLHMLKNGIAFVSIFVLKVST